MLDSGSIFGFTAISVAGRWTDFDHLSEGATTILRRIQELLPRGNTPSLRFPKWNFSLLYNLFSKEMTTDEFLTALGELHQREIIRWAYSYPGNYGYYTQLETLLATVREKEGKEPDKKKGYIVLALPEDSDVISVGIN